MRIRIITDDPAWGQKGAILDVSPSRAERWVERKIAEYLAEEMAPEPEPEPAGEPVVQTMSDVKPEPRRRRGRPRKKR